MKLNNAWWMLGFVIMASCSDKKSTPGDAPAQLFHLLDAAQKVAEPKTWSDEL